jgi:hypothetical protein
LLKEALEIHRKLGNRFLTALSLVRLGTVAQSQADHRTALALFKEALTIQWELGDRRNISESLERFAAVAFALAGPDPAARTWGRAERLRKEIGAPMPPSQRPWYDRQVAAARGALGDDAAFDLAWHEGQTVSLEQAVQYALDVRCSAE